MVATRTRERVTHPFRLADIEAACDLF